jgi:hypothetical protein
VPAGEREREREREREKVAGVRDGMGERRHAFKMRRKDAHVGYTRDAHYSAASHGRKVYLSEIMQMWNEGYFLFQFK